MGFSSFLRYCVLGRLMAKIYRPEEGHRKSNDVMSIPNRAQMLKSQTELDEEKKEHPREKS
jgi:hypothetical protein